MTVPLLSVSGLSKTFRSGGREVAALDNVSLDVFPGETLGLVGPSGSGKSTLARVIMRLVSADAGSILFDGVDLLSLEGARLRQQRKRLQMVFQDPLAAFNPRATVASALDDPLRIHRIVPAGERRRASEQLLERVGLPTEFITRSIHEISGGQRQRVAIARALATEPDLLVLDEAVSALDLTVRNRILDLLVDLQRERGLSYIFVSHDLAVVRAIAHRVAIMDRGRIAETGPTPEVVADPKSAIGRALVAAVPTLRKAG
ncbi:MAG TPA: dipeptide/oligopeptide/nickel ABC transporter ATP-binding protein [Devosia sp.]|nr:dipeptide/oligopeptide/nickel ABC transporter ATP-binding protein [Devosia sp.]